MLSSRQPAKKQYPDDTFKSVERIIAECTKIKNDYKSLQDQLSEKTKECEQLKAEIKRLKQNQSQQKNISNIKDEDIDTILDEIEEKEVEFDPKTPKCVCGNPFGPMQSARNKKCNHCNKIPRGIGVYLYICQQSSNHDDGLYNMCTRCWNKKVRDHTNEIARKEREKLRNQSKKEDGQSFYKQRGFITISQLETFIGKKHNDKVKQLLLNNLDIMLGEPKDIETAQRLHWDYNEKDESIGALWWHKEKVLHNCMQILSIEKNTQYYDYYAFYTVDFLFHVINGDKSVKSKQIMELLEPLYRRISKGETVPRISSASVYGMIARAMMTESSREEECYADYIKQSEYFGYFTDELDINRCILDLITKGMRVDPKNKYCAFALALYLENKQAHNKSIKWIKLGGFENRFMWKVSMNDRFENNKRKYDHDFVDFTENKDNIGVNREKTDKRLAYILLEEYDWESIDKSEEMVKNAYNEAYQFYYLPDFIRNDPIMSNDLKGKGIWITTNDYQYDKKAGDACKTHSFYVPNDDVSTQTNILKEWAKDEKYTIKWHYSLNELLQIIDDSAKQLNEDNVDIIMKDKKDGDNKPLFWDTTLSVFNVLSKDAEEDITKQRGRDMCHHVFNKLLAVFDYIGKHGYQDNIKHIFGKLNELWNLCKDNYTTSEFHERMVWLLVHKATSNEIKDDEKKDSDIEEKKQFESKVNILKWLNNGDPNDSWNNGWINDGVSGVRKDDVMEKLKQQYQAQLDALGSVLTKYYNNKLFKDIDYDKTIDAIKSLSPSDDEKVLRQDNNIVLQRCRWGPIDDDGINKKRYKEDLTKYGVVPGEVAVKPISNSFKNAYIDCVLKIGDKLQNDFQKSMKELFADTNGEFCEAPIKKFQRCLQKIDYDYCDSKEPVGAHILDIVRCLVVYKNIKDLAEAYHLLASKYKVCRLKNNFIKDAKVFGNYRCLMVNILYQHPTNNNIKMICEVQLTLTKIYLVRLTMHKTYKLFRAILPADDAMLF